jgi:hypothetical protein
MNTAKKAQMEMIGLVFIVFLMALGMFFMVSTTNKENRDAKILNPQNVELAQNTIDAIKYLKIDCPPPYGKKVRIDDLIRDMVTDNSLHCRLPNLNIVPASEIDINSTFYVGKLISNILNATLDTWSKPYYFTIVKNKGANSEKYLEITGGNCTSNMPGSEGSQPSPLKGGAGTVTMTLFICN